MGWVGRGQVFGKKRLFEEFLCLKRQAQVDGRKESGFTLTLGKTALTFTRVGRQRSLF